MTDSRELIQRLVNALDAETNYTIYSTGERITHPDVIEARAYLAQPEPEYPSDKELLELMPETMQDEFSYAAKVCSDATGGRVKPRIFRVALNTAALEYAQAILAHYTS
jgi:hypothetical protein